MAAARSVKMSSTVANISSDSASHPDGGVFVATASSAISRCRVPAG
jgi:hypothetical protein